MEPTRLVLQGAQSEQMVNAILVVLHMAIEHSRIGLESDPVGKPGSLEPLVAINLVVANDVPDAIGENLCPSTGQRIHPRSLQLLQSFSD